MAADLYSEPDSDYKLIESQQQSIAQEMPMPIGGSATADVLVIGAGLSGLSAAWQAASRGKRIKVIAKGWGATHWSSGCIDVLGYHPQELNTALVNPIQGIETLVRENPSHPYALLGLEHIAQTLEALQALCQQADYPLHGTLEKNIFLPTATGAMRPTCLAPQSMIAGDLSSAEAMLLVGFDGYLDFYPHMAAANLSQQGIPATAMILELNHLDSTLRVDNMTLARLFDQPEFRSEVVEALKTNLGKVSRIGFPAVLGLKNSLEAQQDLETRLGCRVFEISGLPPSVPGIRLHNIFMSAIQKVGGRVENGMEALHATSNLRHIEAVWTESAAREISHRAENFILATGGFLGDGLQVASIGYTKEIVFDLPIHNCPPRENWFEQQFSATQGHPIFKAGISVDANFQPIDAEGNCIFDNLYATGANLANGDFLREASLEGIALGSGYMVGKGVAEG